ncbi:MAG TPA: hypothetical protein DCL35_05075 [Candidatus Omnitrophica bacterium]|nr:hypothetical protein [Candidatus Omnitrophota bacterium]
MDRPKVSLVKCSSYYAEDVEAAVKHSVDLLGGIGRFVSPGEKVLLKPNLLTDAAPEKGITTHPEVVRAVIRLIKPVTSRIYCGDSPSVWGGEKKNIDRVYEISGIKKICRQEGVDLVYFTKARMVAGHPLAEFAFSCDRLVNIPKFKTHGLTILTAALKNLFGLVVGMHKMKIHSDNPRPVDLSKVIVDIYGARKPDLNILDGVFAMEGQGPGSSGTLKKANLIAASADGVCLDMVLAALMNIDVFDIPTNSEAIRRGLGHASFSSIDIVGEQVKDLILPDFKLPKTSVIAKMPRWAVNVLSSLMTMKVCADASKCKLCGLCQKGCPADAIRLIEGRPVFDRAKCILCLCCQEVCPSAAIDIKKGLLLKILSR